MVAVSLELTQLLAVKRANSHCLLPSPFRGTHASASTPTWFCLAPNPILTDPTLRFFHGGARCRKQCAQLDERKEMPSSAKNPTWLREGFPKDGAADPRS